MVLDRELNNYGQLPSALVGDSSVSIHEGAKRRLVHTYRAPFPGPGTAQVALGVPLSLPVYVNDIRASGISVAVWGRKSLFFLCPLTFFICPSDYLVLYGTILPAKQAPSS